jgi:hypothetical protein
MGFQGRDPSTRDQQIVFWDGISFISNNLSIERRAAIAWLECLVQDRPTLNLHVFVSGDVNSTVAHGKPCCISFSYLTRRQDIATLAIHVSAQFSQVVFNCALFKPLKDALLDPTHEKVCATTNTANDAHTVLLRFFKINVTTLRAIAETSSEWLHHFRSDQTSVRAVANYVQRLMMKGNNIRVNPEVIIEAVTTASYSLSSQNALRWEESNLLMLVVGALHRTMVGFLCNEFDQRRRIAVGPP